MKPRIAVLAAAMVVSGAELPAEIEKRKVHFEWIESIALDASKQPFVPATDEKQLPEALRGLDEVRHRAIRFRPERELWKGDKLPFGLSLVHLGHLYRQPVSLFEFSGDYNQDIRFSRDLFDYSKAAIEGTLPPGLGYAGFRLSHPFHRPDQYEEAAVFQGASYFRMLGKGQAFGLSARGLALNAGIDGVKEEFPHFTRFWLGKPQPGATSVTVFALLNSPSVAGAYQFVIQPGEATVAKVQATLYFRKPVDHVGIAPLTSMFWYGENTTRPFDDHRPEVHDSDGLAIRTVGGERLWRPLRSEPARNRTYALAFDSIQGFGLLQRDRSLRSYEDPEANHHRRPGVWIEPEGTWGSGTVRLVELAAPDEPTDNIVASWEPAVPPAVGEPFRIAYRQTWSMDPNPGKAGSWVVATRSGAADAAAGRRRVILEFAGPALTGLAAGVVPEADLTIGTPGISVTRAPSVQRHPDGASWRVTFEVARPAEAPPSDGVELRCALKQGTDYLSETWTGWLPL